MNCETARNLLVMNAGKPSPPEVGAHLETCDACRTFARRDAALRDLLKAEAAVPADVEREERIVRGVLGRIETVPWWRCLRPGRMDPAAWRWSTAAAAALVLTLFVWNRSAHETDVAPELAVQTPTEFRPVIVTPPAARPAAPALATPPRLVVMTGHENDSDATNTLPQIRLEPLPGEGMVPVNFQP